MGSSPISSRCSRRRSPSWRRRVAVTCRSTKSRSPCCAIPRSATGS
jgi:hypothetical protein